MRHLAALLCLLLLLPSARAADPPPLERPDAVRILEFMNWRDITLIAIRQGVDAKGVAAPIHATALGLGTLEGQRRSICQSLYFDRELDWHALELTDKSARLWTRNGYREIKPWATW